jgi:5'-nucleotidase
MRILLTNDDGIRAPGLVAMYRELSAWGETSVVAPEGHQSATGHGITLSTPLLTTRVKVEVPAWRDREAGSFTGVAVDGRPADCTKLALAHIVRPEPDLVVSGMNAGANVGINVLYSGTCAAALEAAFLSRPAIAVSLFLRREVPTSFAWAAHVAMRTIRRVWEGGLRAGEVVSINVPAIAEGVEPRGVRVVRQCVRPWVDTYEKRVSPKTGEEYYWNNSNFTLGESEDDTDVAALREGYVTVTPLMFDLTRHEQVKRMRAVEE